MCRSSEAESHDIGLKLNSFNICSSARCTSYRSFNAFQSDVNVSLLDCSDLALSTSDDFRLKKKPLGVVE
jgi:hypothetical protein